MAIDWSHLARIDGKRGANVMLRKTTKISLCLFFLWSQQPAYAQSAQDDALKYKIKQGDTLIGFATQYLIRTSSYHDVQKYNKISNVYTLPIGKTILIPRSLLKYRMATARLLAVRGNVTVDAGQAKTGQTVNEGSKLRTASASFVTLGLDSGSRISLPSNTAIRIRTLRNYIIDGSLDYDFDLLDGGAQSNVVPLKSENDRYRVRTPKAVSAVRGTDFQARFDSVTNSDFAEVTEGALAVATAQSEAPLPAGFGLYVAANDDATTENMLAEPKLLEPGKVQADPALIFATDPAPKESGYRFTLAKDAGFIELLADTVVFNPEARFESLENGNYFIRARAISASGIQGLPITYSFKRRLNGVDATVSAGSDGYAFKWLSDGQGIRKFHFQLFKDKPQGVPLVDEPALASEQISLSDLQAGTYFWRVGAVQYLDTEVATNWTNFEKLSVAP
jgi:hypothetical protein